MSSLTAIVYITIAKHSGGYNDGGIPIVRAQMELEGKLREFNYGNLKKRLTRDTKTSVYVDLEFTEEQEVSVDCEDKEKNYIGTIQLTEHEKDEHDDTEVGAIVCAKLPIKMFPQLLLMEGKYIALETIHDIIKNPTEDQKTDHIVAFVKRVYFKISVDSPEQGKKKSWLFG